MKTEIYITPSHRDHHTYNFSCVVKLCSEAEEKGLGTHNLELKYNVIFLSRALKIAVVSPVTEPPLLSTNAITTKTIR